MALNKWQQREAAQHAQDNDVTAEEAAAELFPEDAPAPQKRRPVPTVKSEPKSPAGA